MQEQVHLEQSPDRPTMRRFLACQNSILEKGASEGGRESDRGREEGERLQVGEVPPKSETLQFVQRTIMHL